MQKIDLDNEEITEVEKTFWGRQFQKEATRSQKMFDGLFGILLPVACFAFDPAVFKTSEIWGAHPYLGHIKPFAYLMSFVSVMALMAFLIWGAKLKWINGFLTGFFLVGGIISFGIGVVLLPISLFGLLILIGALGFTPLITALVYLRNSVRTYKNAIPFLSKRNLLETAILAALFGSITPAAVNFEINRKFEKIRNGDAHSVYENARYLNLVAPIIDTSSLIEDYNVSETSEEKRKALSDVYKQLTGSENPKWRQSAGPKGFIQ